MKSRLDRLFTLLEQGQSSFVRKTAAYQIGEIVKTHTNELEPLLEKVKLKRKKKNLFYFIIISIFEKLKPLIVNSQSWDTRVAASHTIECIMKNLPSTYIISTGSRNKLE